jgi:hypothetical protein
MTKIPLQRGFAPTRWKHCLDVRILKKSGVTDLSALHTVVLFHVGCSMMRNTEKAKVLAPEQHGSRKHHGAINLAVKKAMGEDFLKNTP